MRQFIFDTICNIVMNTVRLSKLMLVVHLPDLYRDLEIKRNEHPTDNFRSAFLSLSFRP